MSFKEKQFCITLSHPLHNSLSMAAVDQLDMMKWFGGLEAATKTESTPAKPADTVTEPADTVTEPADTVTDKVVEGMVGTESRPITSEVRLIFVNQIFLFIFKNFISDHARRPWMPLILYQSWERGH